ncbi:REC8 meiotic recombination protein b [Sphaeramia orbicularis]|uniref:REC8 meiotic recombination protein b n=1 Tax=Sphaeramia orbicularis TaxID=375764 RepID=UPI00117E6332|nr:meiotic recombination protein REC8 homolog [Sphaeramia orbicularis]
MFYYPNVLQRHSGCFSTIWLAATRGVKITRRELLKVNVGKTCLDILDYVTAQVAPPHPNLPRPRFSLYLSSQLQYGVVVVYHRQCGFLLDEIQQAIDRLLRSKRHIPIDLTESDRMALDMPDRLYMMEEAEGAQDPFFGLMESHQLPSPYKIQQPLVVIEDVDSQHSLVPSPYTVPDTEDFRSPRATITLTEKEQFVITNAECFEGDDLPEVTTREIDLLIDQKEHFLQEAEAMQTDEQEKSREIGGAMSSIDQLKETVLGTDRDSVWLLDEETSQPVEVPLMALTQEMTPVKVAMPTPSSGASGKERESSIEGFCAEEVPHPPRKPGRGRRRQLVFADPEIQISDRAMKEQIGNPLVETLDLSKVLLDLPSFKLANPAQLFSAPCGPLLHCDLQSLWKHCAALAVVPGQEKKRREEEEEEESEQEREILRTERKRRHSTMKEIPSDSGPAEGSSALDVILDVSREDKSGSDVMTPVSRWSPQMEVQPPMEPIAEENIEMPEAQTDAENRDLLSWISSSLQRSGEVTFDSLLPPEADRSTAAHTLHQLLELLSAGRVTAHQTEPYNTITLNPAVLRTSA